MEEENTFDKTQHIKFVSIQFLYILDIWKQVF